jgi:Ca2+-binding EF-hand superfamily protein
MMTRRTAFLTVLAVSGMFVAWPAMAAPSRAMKLLDTDNDGTVDLAEAKKAASALFDKLDRDGDGTLDRNELRAA